jgi:hypothetical protein
MAEMKHRGAGRLPRSHAHRPVGYSRPFRAARWFCEACGEILRVTRDGPLCEACAQATPLHLDLGGRRHDA